MTWPYDPEFTCLHCGEGGHPDDACPAPVERAVVGYVCRHVGTRGHVRVKDPEYGCADDEPVYEGDTVHTDTRFEVTGTPGQTVVRGVEHVTVSIVRGCRAEHEGAYCDLPAGHRAAFNHAANRDERHGSYRSRWAVKR